MSSKTLTKKVFPSEAQEQAAFIQWCSYQKPFTDSPNSSLREFIFAIPNGGSRHPLEALNLKKQGISPGVPDLMVHIPIHPYHGLFIEMKSKTGKLSPYQKIYLQKLSTHYAIAIAHSAIDAQTIVLNYLDGKHENQSLII